MFFLSDYKTHYKQIIRLGGPIMLGQLGVIIVAFADNIMVGHHLMEELAAASFVNNFFTLASIFGIGFSYGLTPVISEHAARKEWSKGGALLKNGFCFGYSGYIISNWRWLTSIICQCVAGNNRCEIFGVCSFSLSFRIGFTYRIHQWFCAGMGCTRYLVGFSRQFNGFGFS
ncbi:MAG: MATE family efflux transporter, partial [Massilibacteroides sp.]|nr:MATE family efflux transporter [Massilibacteroides sp.]